MDIVKLTPGFVRQIWSDGELVSQEFVSEGEVVWENTEGDTLKAEDLPVGNYPYSPYDMVQPKGDDDGLSEMMGLMGRLRGLKEKARIALDDLPEEDILKRLVWEICEADYRELAEFMTPPPRAGKSFLLSHRILRLDAEETTLTDLPALAEELPYVSEEMCAHCGEVFNTRNKMCFCPICWAIMPACNACISPTEGFCGDCERASNFKLQE